MWAGDTSQQAAVTMQGSSPSVQEALDLHFMLSKSDTQLRQPVDLEEQLMSDSRLDSIVGRSMLQLLQVCPFLPAGCKGCCAASSFKFGCTRLLYTAVMPFKSQLLREYSKQTQSRHCPDPYLPRDCGFVCCIRAGHCCFHSSLQAIDVISFDILETSLKRQDTKLPEHSMCLPLVTATPHTHTCCCVYHSQLPAAILHDSHQSRCASTLTCQRICFHTGRQRVWHCNRREEEEQHRRAGRDRHPVVS